MGEIPREPEDESGNIENGKSTDDQIAEIETVISSLRKSKPEGWTEKILELMNQSQELRKNKLKEIKIQREELAPKLGQAHKETETARKKFEEGTKEELRRWGIK